MAPVFNSNPGNSNQLDSCQAELQQTNLQKALRSVISTRDRGFIYGDGVFETVRCCDKKLLLWELHRNRLLRSCETLAIPLNPEILDSLIAEALSHLPAPECILKIIVTRGEGGRGYAPPEAPEPVIVLQWHAVPHGIRDSSLQGIDCIFCDHPLSLNPVTAGIKHLNRLDQVMASLQLNKAVERSPSIKEGLMFDVDGHVVEGTRSNIFVVIDGRLCTPDLSRAGVQGVMRSLLIERIKAAGIAIEIRHIHRHELSLASELFVCNSVLGIWPVARILNVEKAAGSVELQFPARQMADFAKSLIQENFPV